MKAIAIVKYTFLIIGLAMLVGAFFLFNSTQGFLKSAVTAEGKVIELVRSRSSDSTTYRPVVEFVTREGARIEFTSSSGSNPPSYSRGEVVEVLYQEASPDKAKINGFFSLWGGSTIVGVLGFVFFLVGFLIIFLGTRKAKKIDHLKRNGFPVTAKFQSVELNSSLKVNGRSPYRICVQWLNPATSELHLFYSENIWFDPADYIKNDEFTVLIEKGNPKKYYVDVAFLPKVAD